MARYNRVTTGKMQPQAARAILLTDLERFQIAKSNFVDLFGLTRWEECSMVQSMEEFQEYCVKHQIIQECERT